MLENVIGSTLIILSFCSFPIMIINHVHVFALCAWQVPLAACLYFTMFAFYMLSSLQLCKEMLILLFICNADAMDVAFTLHGTMELCGDLKLN